MKPTIKQIRVGGDIRYRFVVDVGVDPRTRKRKQLTRTFDYLQDAEFELERILDELRRGTYVHRRQMRLLLPGNRGPRQPAWRLAREFCSATCLLATESEDSECICRCRGEYHGLLTEVEVPIPDRISIPEEPAPDEPDVLTDPCKCAKRSDLAKLRHFIDMSQDGRSRNDISSNLFDRNRCASWLERLLQQIQAEGYTADRRPNGKGRPSVVYRSPTRNAQREDSA